MPFVGGLDFSHRCAIGKRGFNPAGAAIVAFAGKTVL